jgi:hypothetical protein
MFWTALGFQVIVVNLFLLFYLLKEYKKTNNTFLGFAVLFFIIPILFHLFYFIIVKPLLLRKTV